jgi:hypothetical protein
MDITGPRQLAVFFFDRRVAFSAEGTRGLTKGSGEARELVIQTDRKV